MDAKANFGQQLRNKMVALGLVRDVSEFRGCTIEEIEQVRIAQKADFLPKIYREFLREMGRRCPPILRDYTFDYPDLGELKEWLQQDAKDLKRENFLPPDAFIIASGSDGRRMFIRTQDRNEDPIVHEYFLGWEEGEPIAPLSKWFELTIQVAVKEQKLWRQIGLIDDADDRNLT